MYARGRRLEAGSGRGRVGDRVRHVVRGAERGRGDRADDAGWHDARQRKHAEHVRQLAVQEHVLRRAVLRERVRGDADAPVVRLERERPVWHEAGVDASAGHVQREAEVCRAQRSEQIMECVARLGGGVGGTVGLGGTAYQQQYAASKANRTRGTA